MLIIWHTAHTMKHTNVFLAQHEIKESHTIYGFLDCIFDIALQGSSKITEHILFPIHSSTVFFSCVNAPVHFLKHSQTFSAIYMQQLYCNATHGCAASEWQWFLARKGEVVIGEMLKLATTTLTQNAVLGELESERNQDLMHIDYIK